MKKLMVRAGIVAGATAAVLGLAGGLASAAPSHVDASQSASDTPSGTAVWLFPGIDGGSLLDPLIAVPTTALAPVDGLLTLLNR
jgi:hypothetical protein